ncbi:IclR family transcriptional regulator [Nocardioides sp.]|uniref:IclR family transcriptional regulator n=1 Tax=Nocardioides sp. TaxID=35761 RepID=UPI00351902E1
MAGRSAPGAALVPRAFDLLGAFDEQHRSLALAELAERTGLASSTTLRIARQLVDVGALERRGDGRYVVGRRIWDLGLLAPVEQDLREIASPYLHDLHAATRATVHLAVREDTRVLYLDRLAGRASVPVVSRVGTHLPLHATGVGKVLLAHAPESVVLEVLGDLPRLTAHTVTQPGVLAAQLERVRREGHATTAEEMTLGACSAAVPIRAGGDGAVVAALGVVVPSLRRDRARLVAALEVAAQGIGRRLRR